MATSRGVHVRGIPVHAEPSFFVVAALIGLGGGRSLLSLAVWVAIVLVSVLWHELGHAMVFRAFGHSPEIALHAMGGLTSVDGRRPLSPKQRFLVAVAGPGAGLLAGGVALVVTRLVDTLLPSVMATALTDLVVANVVWSLFNLLPVLPLDGGQGMESVLDRVTDGRGRVPALVVSLVVGAGLVVGAFVVGRAFTAVMIGAFSVGNVVALVNASKHGRRNKAAGSRGESVGASQQRRKKPNKRGFGFWCGVVIFLLLAAYVLAVANTRPRVDGDALRLDQFVSLVNDASIRDARILDQDEFVVGTYERGDGSVARYNVPYVAGGGHTNVPDLLISNDVPTVVDHQFGKRLVTPATMILPALIVVVVFIYLILSYQRGTGLFAVSSGARRMDDGGNVTFADVAGQEAAITELREIKEFLANPEHFASLGALVPKGILLFGPPGCGKTLLARAVAGESGAAFFSISGSDFVELYVGVGAARVRDLFREAREHAPAIVFIDELDSVGRRRGGGGPASNGSQDEQEQALNQILTELDGFSPLEGIIVMAATNRPDILDPALLRPGRFDRTIALERPDEGARLAILTLHAGTKPVDPGVDLASVARRAIGLSGADLANVMNEAALLSGRAGATTIGQAQLDEALSRVLEAPERHRRLSMRARGFSRSSGLDERVGFADVAGAEQAIAELSEVREYLAEPERFAAMGAKPPKGFLLVGPPGCGKTLLARAVANESNAAFFSVAATEFVEMFVGEGAGRVRDLFAEARAAAPAIVFLDELDAVGTRRSGSGEGVREREQTLNQILVELDGFDGRAGVTVMAASNRPEILDEALVRPGRFDRTVVIDLPDRAARRAILDLHAKTRPMAADVDLEVVAGMTQGFSGADLAQVVNEAALLAARGRLDGVTMAVVHEAVSRVGLGVARARAMSAEDRASVAYHEVGHALVARALPGASRPQVISVVSRGRSLGSTWQVDEIDRLVLPRSALVDRMAGLLGGRAAEQLVFGEPGSGAADDLRRVGEIARRMVCELGMGEGLSPLDYPDGVGSHGRSEELDRAIENEVGRLVDEAHAKALAVLTASREALEKGARALLERETLSATELDAIAGPPLPVALAVVRGGSR